MKHLTETLLIDNGALKREQEQDEKHENLVGTRNDQAAEEAYCNAEVLQEEWGH